MEMRMIMEVLNVEMLENKMVELDVTRGIAIDIAHGDLLL